MAEPLESPLERPAPTASPMGGDSTDNVPTLLDPNQPRAPLSSGDGPPQKFGDYELLSEIARGGMGVVYRARQRGLERIVALKMILAGKRADQEELQRFFAEALAAAQLQHPNIVAVHEVGEVEGQPFFSMELIDGNSLAQRLREGPLGSKEAAHYLVKIARAIHHAHRQGILHRDLKPSNILIDRQNEPHITDFGLAKRLHHDSGQTRTGAILGTPSYMAPEQAAGKSRELGPACDVYGLGAVLYELLTSRPPFRAESAFDTAMQVLHNDPVPPRLLNDRIDHDLETICLKCLEKEPRDRYASAEALADDLQRYLDGETINARSFNILDRLQRTLDHSRNDRAFHTWSTMILVMALVVCAEHVIVYFLIEFRQPSWMVQTMRLTQFFVLGCLFWYNRPRSLLPTTSTERELWTIWIGYFLAYMTSIVVTRFLVREGAVELGPHGPYLWREVLPYPFISIASGLAFFVMGCNYWGWCYVIGILFWIAAMLISFDLEIGPLVFGILWSGALLALGLHLRRLGHSAESEEQTVKLKTRDMN